MKPFLISMFASVCVALLLANTTNQRTQLLESQRQTELLREIRDILKAAEL